MPNCSPNGKKLVYMEQINHAMTLRVCDINGENTKTIIDEGMNVIPSWMPDSLHIVWMKVQPNKEQKDRKRHTATTSQLERHNLIKHLK